MLRRRAQGGTYSPPGPPAWPLGGAPLAWWPARPAKTPELPTHALSGLELAASDANGEVNPVFGLNWGYHQHRHVELADGTLYLAYHRTKVMGATPGQGVIEAVVRKRTPTGLWTEEGAWETVDDVFLEADQAAQEVHLVHARKTAGNPVMTVLTFPGAVQADVPGDWTNYARPNSGRYWAAGIGADGMLVIKISVDGGTGAEATDATTQRFIFGKRIAGVWTWTAQRTESVGIRKGYDALFAGVNGSRLAVLGLGAWNPHREDYPLALAGGGVDYLFSGVNSYTLGAGGAAFAQQTVQQPQPQGAAGSNPVSRMHGMLICHTDARVYLTYWVTNSSAKADGWWLMVLSANGATVLADVHLSAAGYFPTYNYAQLAQDATGQVYVLQFSEGPDAAQFRVFPLAETSANTFSIPLIAQVPDIGPALFGTLRPYTMYLPRLNGGARLPANHCKLLFAVAEDAYPAAGERWPSDPGYGRNIGRLYTVDLQFATRGTLFDFDFSAGPLDPAITYTRAGPATQVYEDGNVDWSPENTIPSSDLASAQWTLGAVPVPVLNVPPPVVGGLVYECEFNASNLIRRVGPGSLGSAAYAGLPMTRSVWVRRGRTLSAVAVNVTSNNTLAWSTGGTARVVLTDEWQRVSIEDLIPSGNCYFMIGATQGNNFTDITAYGKVLVCAPRYQRGSHSLPQDDVLTTLSNVPNYNAPRFDYSTGTRHLLAEAQVTNYFLNSRDAAAWVGPALNHTVVSNSVVAPDGTLTADAITLAPEGYFYQNCFASTLGAWVAGIWLRADAPVSIPLRIARTPDGALFATVAVNVTTTWQRVSLPLVITGSLTAVQLGLDNRAAFGAAATTKTVHVWGGQCELGARPTSNIPTTASTALRAADVIRVTGSEFTSRWNPAEGSAYIEGYCAGGSTHLFATFDNGAATDLISLVAQRAGSSGGAGTQIFSGGVLQCDLLQSSLPATSAGKKLAVSWKAAEIYSVQGGQPLKTSLTAALPAITPNRLIIGDRSVGGVPLNGGIKRLRYWPCAKTAAELETLVA